MGEGLPAWCLWDAKTRSIKPSRHSTHPELGAEMLPGGPGLSIQGSERLRFKANVPFSVVCR